MTQLGPFLTLIGVAAIALAGLGGAMGWYNAESRSIRRGLRKVLRHEPHAMIIAPGRGRGAGFNFTSGTMAVAWDAGAWCLIYRIEELLGVELIVDGQVAGRAFRGEPRRAVDVLGGAEKQVSLRLIFDDPQHADFMLELWNAARVGRRPGLESGEAVEEGNRWLARLESMFRRKPATLATRVARPPQPEPEPHQHAAPQTAAAPPPPQPQPSAAAPPPAGARQDLPFGEPPPWEDDEDGQEALL